MTIVYHAVELIQTWFTFYPPFANGQSRAVNTSVPYLDKNSDFGLGDMFLVFSMTSA